MKKYLSRKFLICVAAFLGSIGTSIAALHSDNPTIAGIGIISAMISAAIYAACEAWVDAANATKTQVFKNLEDDKEDDYFKSAVEEEDE